MATTTKSKAPTVAEAAEHATKTRERLDYLTGRLTSGDASVTREELDEARADAEYAELALEGARVRERREAEEQLRADVDKFTQTLSKRVAAVVSDMTEARTKAVQALQDYADTIAAVRHESHDAEADYLNLRPDDVPLDFDDDLPDWLKAASPSKQFPKIDTFPSLLSVALRAFDGRRTGTLTASEAEHYRNIDAYVKQTETALHNATRATTTD